MTRPLALLVAALCVPAGASPARAQATSPGVSGFVFVDRNGNGRKDANEPGLAGVAVSDQRAVAVTDASGRYALPFASGGTGLVFVSVPDGYRATPRHWRAAPAAGAPAAIDFALVADATPASFTFIHASDTHISEASVERTRRLGALVDSLKPRFVLISGDLVKDALRVGEPEARRYYDLYLAEIAKFSAPVWSVPGNHENFGIERDRKSVV
jgi:hypothetical protein